MKSYALFKEYIWLVNTINFAGKITLEDINRKWVETDMSAAEYTPGKTAVIAAGASTSSDFPLWAERNRKIVIPPPQAPDPRRQTGNRGFVC